VVLESTGFWQVAGIQVEDRQNADIPTTQLLNTRTTNSRPHPCDSRILE
jgi:hypothetical protein